MEQGMYEGRRGHKRLKALEKQIEKVNSEFQTRYTDAPELTFLKEECRWEGSARLIFAMAFRNVNFAWNGLRDYGFIRLCKKWVVENHVEMLTSKNVVAMLRSILPTDMCDELGEELSALEIS